ncbi:anaerobic sulfatase maturase [Clostridium sp. Ade.TY]|uniref:anaerobic sulfatase maturase n=1 Tax=Clostridium sp. Ade.TY TaxID=1391647 RepID=UPI00041C2797|nr:anaerobic sulfatase maturase [Clostridium sp. Ade.TY]
MCSICLLIKPASSNCNLNCKYCFYKDVAKNRKFYNNSFMSLNTTENLIKNIFNETYTSINFAFQGGEPTLCGINYFKAFINLVNKYNIKKVKVSYSIQTNGYNLKEDFIKLFKENKFLVGISLDGPKDINDTLRLESEYKGSFNKVKHSIELLKKYEVDFNILCVLTSFNSKHIEKVYNFFKKENFKYLQFIPCIKELNIDNTNLLNQSQKDFYLKDTDYLYALNTLFKLYKDDYFNNNYISIRQFDNYVRMLLNKPPENCTMSGVCGVYFVIESNGDIYPCDFYATDKYKLGNININSFKEITNSDILKNFINESKELSARCINCKYFKLCRGGCKRYRTHFDKAGIPLNEYCGAYYNFFEKNLNSLISISRTLL